MSENDERPRLTTKQQAAAYCGVSGPTFTKWVLAGDMPGPFRSTRMYDRRAIDLTLDKAAGISQGAPPKEDALDKWRREKAEREARSESAFDRWEREEAVKAAASMTPYRAALATSGETSHEKWYRESQARKARKAERARVKEVSDAAKAKLTK